ncbi:transposase [Streptomyces radicis]|uniref:transposase n=1 Tax=Streptomyces radicis TaxID=1750517 RepID=UPI0016043F09|nr:transposase [Streptomyces radicis]
MTLSSAGLKAEVADDGAVGKKKPGPRAGGPRRRTFTPEYKLRIVEEYERLSEPGAKGALLRREGLYHSHIIDWRTARDAGALDALAVKRTGPKGKPDVEMENGKLRAENERLAAELAKSQKALAILGKAHELLELLSEHEDSGSRRTK